MHFKRHIELESGLKPIDITPLIDMVFQLLIFFMLTSSFVMSSGIKVNLPKTSTSDSLEVNKNLAITISRENIMYVGSRVITNRELKDILNITKKNNGACLISADHHADFGRVVEIWDMARDMGISQVNIATDAD